MTTAEKAEAFDLIRDIVIDEQKTEAYFLQRQGMGAHIESVQAHAFKGIVKRFFAGDLK